MSLFSYLWLNGINIDTLSSACSLTQLLTIFQFCYGSAFYWKKESRSHLSSHVTGKFYWWGDIEHISPPTKKNYVDLQTLVPIDNNCKVQLAHNILTTTKSSPIKNVHRYLNSRKYMQGSVDGLGKYTTKLYKYLLVENKT